METAFTTIADYCLEKMIDESKVSYSYIYKINDKLVLYGDDVTFEIKDYYGEEDKTI